MPCLLCVLCLALCFAASLHAENVPDYIELKGHTGGVHSVAFSPDGEKIVTGGAGQDRDRDTSIRIWNIESGKELQSLEKHGVEVKAVAFSPDGKRIATIDHDVARIWDAESGKELYKLEGHTNAATSVSNFPGVTSIAFSPDSKKIATSGRDSTVRLWDVDSGKELYTLEGHKEIVSSVTFSPDGKRIASTDLALVGDSIRIWDVETGKELQGLGSRGFRFALFAPDGRKIVAAGHADATFRQWDVESGEELEVAGTGVNRLHFLFTGPRDELETRIDAAAFSPDGNKLITGNSEGTVQIWDVESGKLLHTWKGHPVHVSSVAFSPDGKKVATVSWSDNAVRIWTVPTSLSEPPSEEGEK